MKLPIYFISDVHLMMNETEEEKQRQKKLFHFMNYVRTTRGTLFFVGDLFDFYFEYNDLIPKAYFNFYNKVFQLKKAGVDLRFVAGNHDYWFLDFIKNKLMNKTYTDDTTFSTNSKNFYITHGDGILSWDYGYRILKKVIRSPLFIFLFRLLHPTISYSLAKRVSKTHEHREPSREKIKKIRDELIDNAKTHFDNGFDFMICGHYHLNEIIQINEGRLIVLGDWMENPSYAVFDGENLSLHDWEHDA